MQYSSLGDEPMDILDAIRQYFGTPLVSYLNDLRIDTLIVAGSTTSGCVRATVTDAFSYNFRVVIPEECVFDRSPASHAMSLHDMGAKYAHVLPLAEVVAWVEQYRQQG